jgi:chaperone required for assembly of F1-ATPase
MPQGGRDVDLSKCCNLLNDKDKFKRGQPMRELFENFEPGDPMAAARRAARPALRRRFYGKADAVPAVDGYVVRLDEKPVYTPTRRPLAAPTAALAQAIAAEWQAQGEHIDPSSMPLTRLANAIIDGVAEARGPVRAEIEKYLAADLLFYPAANPLALRERQARYWDPILAWARQSLGADFTQGEGMVHLAQPAAALEAAARAIPDDPWRLGALHAVTTVTGSALLALALLRGALSNEAAWQAAHVDEDWNWEQWGHDAIAVERRAFRHAEFEAGAKVLRGLD